MHEFVFIATNTQRMRWICILYKTPLSCGHARLLRASKTKSSGTPFVKSHKMQYKVLTSRSKLTPTPSVTVRYMETIVAFLRILLKYQTHNSPTIILKKNTILFIKNSVLSNDVFNFTGKKCRIKKGKKKTKIRICVR